MSRSFKYRSLANKTVSSPSELGVTLPPVNVGVTADTVRDELVVLGTVLNAAVPASSVSYSPLASDGSVTVTFVQVWPVESIDQSDWRANA